MARLSAVAFFMLNGLLLTGAIPQYGPQGGGSSSAAYGSAGGAPPAAAAPPPPPPPPPAAGGAPAYGGGAPGGGAPGGGAPGGGAPGGSPAGGNDQLTVQCKATPGAGGKFKYDCSGVNKDAITLKTEHFLWLENQAGSAQNLDVEIPNYNIDEFIKAAYKALGPQDGAKINILLKKPDVTYNAEKEDQPQADVGAPAVSVNYQPVEKISVHYPTQKQYSTGGGSGSSAAASAGGAPAAGGASAGGAPAGGAPAGGAPGGAGGNYGGASAAAAPAAAPAAPAAPAGGNYGGGAGAYSRPQRESGYKYYFIRQ
ncbi:unnamed protein product [Orchesella dallaii]|uniref:Uncharacterized protein n=1 Tax=Orchesella dallaii TaxID=48710 RepID=A0ABP1QQM0_9HEXA